jgi:hypothetical protein
VTIPINLLEEEHVTEMASELFGTLSIEDVIMVNVFVGTWLITVFALEINIKEAGFAFFVLIQVGFAHECLATGHLTLELLSLLLNFRFNLLFSLLHLYNSVWVHLFDMSQHILLGFHLPAV